MKERKAVRRILHVDLDPFFVSVERSLDPGLRAQPLVVGGDSHGGGVVAAASAEARAGGVTAGTPIAAVRRLCPQAVLRVGDLDLYARISQEVTALLLGVSRRVERPSVDEAFVDLTPEGNGAPSAVAAAERLKDDIQRRLGLEASLGLAGSRLAARVASRWAKPRGLVVVIPGYEASFVAGQPLSALDELPTHLEQALIGAGIDNLGALAAADETVLRAAVGAAPAARLQAAARGDHEDPIAVTAPPASISEEQPVRTAAPDREALEALLENLASRAVRRLRPFRLVARTLTVEVRRPESSLRRTQDVPAGVCDEETAREVVRALAAPLLSPTLGVRCLQVRLGRLGAAPAEAPLFPGLARRA